MDAVGQFDHRRKGSFFKVPGYWESFYPFSSQKGLIGKGASTGGLTMSFIYICLQLNTEQTQEVARILRQQWVRLEYSPLLANGFAREMRESESLRGICSTLVGTNEGSNFLPFYFLGVTPIQPFEDRSGKEFTGRWLDRPKKYLAIAFSVRSRWLHQMTVRCPIYPFWYNNVDVF
jgi:hypothetical protein